MGDHQRVNLVRKHVYRLRVYVCNFRVLGAVCLNQLPALAVSIPLPEPSFDRVRHRSMLQVCQHRQSTMQACMQQSTDEPPRLSVTGLITCGAWSQSAARSHARPQCGVTISSRCYVGALVRIVDVDCLIWLSARAKHARLRAGPWEHSTRVFSC